MGRLVEVGDVYNRLTVISYHHTDHHPRKFWVCKCVCGGTVVTHSGSLRSGNTKSCGCLAKDVMAMKRKPNNGSEITAVILGYKRHAAARKLRWGLSRDDVVSVIFMACHYCGSAPSNVKKTRNTVAPLFYNGIDRINNSIGYEFNNIVPCCAICNRAKGAASVDEFKEWAVRLAKMADQWGSL
jgi:hypothetical protein